MSWICLIVAGLFEAGWAVGLKYSKGFTQPIPSVLTVFAMIISLYLLAIATRTLPIGTAYGVWVGIGTLGTVILGMSLLGEPVTVPRLLFLMLLLVAIVGLKFTAG